MKIIAFIDGSCEPINPGGIMGVGVWMNVDGKQQAFSEKHEERPDNTNNLAEYLALKKVLDFCEKIEVSELEIFSDSMLLVKQMNGQWRIKHGSYKSVALECYLVIHNFRIANAKISIKWIPREQNVMADSLSQ